MIGVALVLLIGVILFTVDRSADKCDSTCKVSRFLFGNPENRAGKGWFDRGALRGEAAVSVGIEQQLPQANYQAYCDGSTCIYRNQYNQLLDWDVLPLDVQNSWESLIKSAGYDPDSGQFLNIEYNSKTGQSVQTQPTAPAPPETSTAPALSPTSPPVPFLSPPPPSTLPEVSTPSKVSGGVQLSGTTPTSGGTSTQRASGPEIFNPILDDKGKPITSIALPKADLGAYFNFNEQGEITGWKGNAGYNNGVWTTSNGVQVKYDQGGQVRTVGDNVQVWSSQDKGWSAPFSKSLYDQYGSQIDPSKVRSEKIESNLLPLKGGGSIEQYVDQTSGLITTIVAVSQDPNTPVEERTTWTFDNQKFESTDGWKALAGGLIENKEENRKIRFSQEGDARVMIDENTKTNEQTITRISGQGDNLRRELEKKNEDDETTSLEVRDAKNNLLGSGSYDNGDLERFEHYDNNGRVVAYCYQDSCIRNIEDNNNYFVEADAVCKGSRTTCSNRNNWVSQDTACKNQNSKECQAINAKETEMFWHFDGGFWSIALGRTNTQQVIGSILGWRPGWESLSLWWAPDITRSWQKNAQETFDQAMLTEYVVPKAICDYDEAHRVSRPGESATFIEVAPGVVQFVGSITAEKTPQAGPVLCSEELPCVEGECDEDGICREDGQAVEGFFYKISWAVQAPADESFTPFIDENGFAVRFNVRIFGERETWLYPSSGLGTDSTLKLENGASDRDTIVTYSPRDYNQVCILFGAPPKDLSGEEVHEICTDITPSTVGQIEWDQAGRPSSSGSSTGNVRVEDVGRVQI